MTKVTMVVPVSGMRDGEPWPEPGGEATVPRSEAQELIGSKYRTRHRTDPAPSRRPGTP